MPSKSQTSYSTGLRSHPGTSGSSPEIDRFLDAMWMERGLSENTLAAYRADLQSLRSWLEDYSISLLDAKREHILNLVAWREQAGARPRSTARQLSSIRRFYLFILRDRIIDADPSENIEIHRLSRQ